MPPLSGRDREKVTHTRFLCGLFFFFFRSLDCTIRVRSVPTCDWVRRLRGHESGVRCLAFHRTGRCEQSPPQDSRAPPPPPVLCCQRVASQPQTRPRGKHSGRRHRHERRGDHYRSGETTQIASNSVGVGDGSARRQQSLCFGASRKEQDAAEPFFFVGLLCA